MGFIKCLELREINQFNTFKILRIDLKMFTILIKMFFGFQVSYVGFYQILQLPSNERSTDGPCINMHDVHLFLMQCVSVVLNIVRKVRGVSKWVCGHDQMNSKAHNTFNDPFCVRTLIFTAFNLLTPIFYVTLYYNGSPYICDS